MKNLLAVIMVPLLITACTTTDEIIIDEKNVDMSAYEQDLTECKSYASGVKKGQKTAKGAGTGAAIGGVIGGIRGGTSGVAKGAGVGAVGGGAKGASEGEQSEVQVVKRCLSGRGYKVLN